MRNGLVAVFALVLAVLAGTHALAFEEQKAGAAPAEPQRSADVPLDPGLNLSDERASPGAESGTEIRIPGLGKLGVLPKMDFGLELLYGAAEQEQPEGQVESAPTPDDLMIRGTVKHRF
ncbi:MAG: hypothetical protein ACR2OF_07195 [Hyphomicrobium sp.]